MVFFLRALSEIPEKQEARVKMMATPLGRAPVREL